MSTLVLLAILVAALSHATWNAVLKGRGGGPLVASAGLATCWGLMGLPLLGVVEPLPAEARPLLLASVGVHVAYFTLLTGAYRLGDLSWVYPIARGVPPLLLAAGSSLWFAESLSTLSLVGVAAIAAGVVGLGRARHDGAVSARALLAVALGSASCTAMYTVLDGRALRAGASPVSYLVHLTALQGTTFALGCFAWFGRDLAKQVWTNRRTALIAGLLSAAGYGVVLWAMSVAPIALVAALRETSVVFAALLGWRWLGEPLGTRRVAAAAVVTLGAIAVRLGA